MTKFLDLGPDCNSLTKVRIRTGFGLGQWQTIAAINVVKKLYICFWILLRLGLRILKIFWTMTEL